MSTPEPLTVVEEQIAAFAFKDWARYQEALTPDAIYDEKATGRRVQGAAAVTAAVRSWAEPYPDLIPIITKVVACGDAVVAEVTWKGTQTGPLVGPFGTVPPTGKQGEVPAVAVFLFEGSKIKEIRHYFDFLTILRQAGALAAAAAAA